MDQQKIYDLFQEMKANLNSVRQYHARKMDAYEGKYAASVLSITENKKIRKHISASSSWVRTAVDHLHQDLEFDAFKNDTFGLTRMFEEAEGDGVVDSAMRNALIGACSFVAILPRDNELPLMIPFSGAEATGLRESRGSELSYGLAVRDVKNSAVSEWYFFAPGAILILNGEGEVIDGEPIAGNVMPFVEFNYDADMATKPHGRSRISSTAISSLESAVNHLALMEQAGISNVLKDDVFILNASPSDLSEITLDGNVDKMNIILSETPDGKTDVSKIDRSFADTSGIVRAFQIAGEQFASAMSIDPTVLGITPVSGSYSADAMAAMSKPYEKLKRQSRREFGRSITSLATRLYKIATGDTGADFGAISPVFVEQFDIARGGALGDMIGKASMSGVEIDPDHAKRLFGLPLRPEVVNQQYASLQGERADANFGELISEIDAEQEKWSAPNRNAIEGGGNNAINY